MAPLTRVDFFLNRGFARHDHVAAAAVELDDLNRDILTDQGIEVVNGAGIGLRTGHEGLDADIHRETAFDAAENVPGKDELLLVGLIEVVPDAQARGTRMGELDVAFGLLAMLDHHVDHVAGLNRDLAGGTLKLIDGNDAFGFVAEVDHHVLGGDAENGALKNLVGGGWGEVTIVFEKMLVVVSLPVVRVHGHLSLRQSLGHCMTPGGTRVSISLVYTTSAGTCADHRQALKDQYVSKYTPVAERLSTGAGGRNGWFANGLRGKA